MLSMNLYDIWRKKIYSGFSGPWNAGYRQNVIKSNQEKCTDTSYDKLVDTYHGMGRDFIKTVAVK